MERHQRWQLSGDSAEYYNRYVSLLMEPWVQALVDAIEIQPGDRVLDVGCGPGFVARRAAEIVGPAGKVAGQDNNKAMLEKARSIPASETGVPIEWHECDVQALTFTDSSFDVALAQQVLQFCPEPGVALQEMRRVLAPGGRMGFTVWQSLEDNPYPRTQVTVFERYIGADVAAGIRAPYAMGSEERLRDLVTRAGYTDVEVRSQTIPTLVGPAEEFIRGHIPALPFAGTVAALSDGARQAMLEDLITALSGYVVDGVMEFPSASHLVTAKA